MEVILENISKKFGRQTVVPDLSHHFLSGQTFALLGGNGSGKSTVLQMVLGSLTPSSGNITYNSHHTEVKREDAAFKISFASPYLELIEELTATEFLKFYRSFRPLRNNMTVGELLIACWLEDSADKEIRHFSSGMRQRLRLAIALYSNADLILLDEPCSNLDPKGVRWYRQLIEKERDGRTLIIASNFDDREMDFCEHQLRIGKE